MIRVYCAGRSACEQLVDPAVWVLPPDAVWIDLIEPTREEEAAVERALGLSVPTREEMAELEASSRVYRENGATYATADIIIRGDEEIPGIEPVTFVVTDGPLVTIRYADPKPFALMIEKLERDLTRCSVGFEKLITKLGRAQMTNARIEQSLAGLTRIFAFVGIDERMDSEEARAHLRSLTRDAESLSAHNHTVAASINFQLSAALGLINIEQSSIIKIFSVAAVAFLPPTLIASIYGMNFHSMPELSQPWGYPLAVVGMVVSAILPLLWFKKKGWL